MNILDDEKELTLEEVREGNSVNADILGAIMATGGLPKQNIGYDMYEDSDDDSDEEELTYYDSTQSNKTTIEPSISVPAPSISVPAPSLNIGTPEPTITTAQFGSLLQPTEQVSLLGAPVAQQEDKILAVPMGNSNGTPDANGNTLGTQVMTVEERLRKYSDGIMATIIKTTENSNRCRSILFGQFPPEVFRDENYIIYRLVYDLKEAHIVPDLEFVKLRLSYHESIISNAKKYININTFADLDENPVLGYMAGVLKHFVRLSGMSELTEQEFQLHLEKYKLEFQNYIMNEAYTTAKQILNDGIQERGVHKQGFEASMAYVKGRSAYVESLMDKTVGSGFVTMQELLEQRDESLTATKIGDFGKLKKLNDYFGGGIYKPSFYSIVAPPKSGKSKICTRLIHNIVVEHGHNAVVWAQEGGNAYWLSQLRAVHFDYYYNREVTFETDRVMGISQDVIEKGRYPSEVLRGMESVSTKDLMVNPKYGKIQYINRPLRLETFIDDLETAVQMCNADVILIDYLQLIDTEGNKNKSEIVGRAYQKLLAYANMRNLAVIAPAQYNQDFLRELVSAKEGKNVDVRLGGGESSEIIRTPDYNIALYASTDDLIHNRMKILSVPSRKCSAFPAIDLKIDLATCSFEDAVM